MDLFSLKNYKEILVLKTKDRRQQLGSRFSLTRVAAACGIQKTYLSKVLNSDAHLNPDQLTAACAFLNCSDDEAEYCLLLRDQATAQNPHRQRRLTNKLEALLGKVRNTEAWLDDAQKVQEQEKVWTYYTDIYLQLLHLFLTIPSYQRDRNRLMTALGVNDERLTELLLQLETLGLVHFKDQRHQAVDFNFHLSPENPAYRPYRSLQRLKSLQRLDQLSGQAVSYAMSASFAADKATYEQIRTLILGLIKRSQKLVLAAESTNVFQLDIDFFQWDQ
ncbi:MAG: helix-turn-helix transcriptional regulator [Proteobacteria bacterium]|nr:helix-turn-helix transcriptional regulator [Pseudomonadota bacterium]